MPARLPLQSRKVSPPNLPTPDYFAPLGALIAYVRSGKRFVAVEVDDIRFGEGSGGAREARRQCSRGGTAAAPAAAHAVRTRAQPFPGRYPDSATPQTSVPASRATAAAGQQPGSWHRGRFCWLCGMPGLKAAVWPCAFRRLCLRQQACPVLRPAALLTVPQRRVACRQGARFPAAAEGHRQACGGAGRQAGGRQGGSGQGGSGQGRQEGRQRHGQGGQLCRGSGRAAGRGGGAECAGGAWRGARAAGAFLGCCSWDSGAGRRHRCPGSFVDGCRVCFCAWTCHASRRVGAGSTGGGGACSSCGTGRQRRAGGRDRGGAQA